jgi:hypothetical protein
MPVGDDIVRQFIRAPLTAEMGARLTRRARLPSASPVPIRAGFPSRRGVQHPVRPLHPERGRGRGLSTADAWRRHIAADLRIPARASRDVTGPRRWFALRVCSVKPHRVSTTAENLTPSRRAGSKARRNTPCKIIGIEDGTAWPEATARSRGRVLATADHPESGRWPPARRWVSPARPATAGVPSPAACHRIDSARSDGPAATSYCSSASGSPPCIGKGSTTARASDTVERPRTTPS